jgi:holo-[acyl-carrier protein] synthase
LGSDVVIGIGSDLVDVERMRRVLARTPRLVDRLFSADERAYAERRRDPTERLAARFAAKEAVMKAMGVGLWQFPLRDIEVVRAESGQPSVLLHGKAAAVADERGVTEWRLTLSHTDRVAQAIAVAL